MNLGRSWTRSRGWAIDRGWCSTRATTRGSAPTRRRARFDFVFERSSSKPPRETLARRTHRHRHRVRVRSRASPSSPRRIIVERPRRDGARDTRVDEETTRSDAITHAHIYFYHSDSTRHRIERRTPLFCNNTRYRTSPPSRLAPRRSLARRSGLEVMGELCEFTGHAEFHVYRP